MTTNTHTPEYQLLIELLKSRREAAGLTQVQAAAALGMPQSFVSKTERGERRADLIDLLRFLKVYAVHPDLFISDLLEHLPKDSVLHSGRPLRPDGKPAARNGTRRAMPRRVERSR